MDNSSTEPQRGINGYVNSKDSRIPLPVVAVKVKVPGGDQQISCHALLDSGSNRTFCSGALLQRLGISGSPQQLSLSTSERADSIQTMQVTTLEISDMYQTQSLTLSAVFARPELPISADNIPTYEDVTKWPHLRGIDLPVADTHQVMLL